jgi:hypothetical protein
LLPKSLVTGSDGRKEAGAEAAQPPPQGADAVQEERRIGEEDNVLARAEPVDGRGDHDSGRHRLGQRLDQWRRDSGDYRRQGSHGRAADPGPAAGLGHRRTRTAAGDGKPATDRR